jgi:hypothetical protein
MDSTYNFNISRVEQEPDLPTYVYFLLIQINRRSLTLERENIRGFYMAGLFLHSNDDGNVIK